MYIDLPEFCNSFQSSHNGMVRSGLALDVNLDLGHLGILFNHLNPKF